jgi:hypothetical protein
MTCTAPQTAREHYVFTSHAESPLVAWDLRAMGHGPLYSQDRLDHMSEVREVRVR